MATITYNNRSTASASNLITFTDVPNILKVSDTYSGNKQVISLIFNGNLSSVTPPDGYWTITIQGESITSVGSFSNAVNKNFFVSPSNNSTAASVARALRNCSSIIANYTVEHSGNEVELVAREIGNFPTTVDSDISTTYLTRTIAQGSSSSSLYGCKVDVDVIHGNQYLTTLEKNYYKGECAFDMSPVLTTFAERGKTEPYSFIISTINQSGEYSELGRTSTNYITQGYMVNQGRKYIPLGSSAVVAQNYSRGTEKEQSNNTLLYVYGNSIPFSYYSTNNSLAIDIHYLNSAFEEVGSADYNYTKTSSDLLANTDIPLSNTLLRDSFYVDIEIEQTGETIRYNVIKPIKAAEYYQRILWRNSYGGVSFFDFTGQKTEARDLDVETYQKSIFDYYTDPRNELEKVYDNKVKYTVTLKSHLFENDGKYVFNDLLQSPEVWTERNGEEYAIIIDSVNVDETDRNNIFEATVKFHYSQEPSLI